MQPEVKILTPCLRPYLPKPKWKKNKKMHQILFYKEKHLVIYKLQILTSFSQFIESTIHMSHTSFATLAQTMPSQSPY
jgi:hypothetical protein